MNNRNLAIKISKHPLLRKLTEDKAIPSSIVARLIVEELLKEDIENLNKAIEASSDEELKQLFQKFLETLESGDSSKIKFDAVVSKLLFMVNRKKLEQAKKQLADSIKQMGGEQPDSQGADSQLKPILDKFAKFLKKSGVLRENINALIKALQPKDEKVFGDSFGKNFKEDEIKVLKQYFEKKENIVLFVKQYFGNNPEKNQILQNVEKALSGQPIKQDFEPEEDTKDAPKSGPQIPIQQENVDEFLKSTDEFLKEFYRKSYKIEQATAIDEVLKSLGKMVEDENLAKAAQRVPDKKEEPKPEEATAEEQPEQSKLKEQEEEQKQASKDELRNLRIGMNSLLKRINYSRKALDRFKDTAGKGSVLASGDKKKFIKVLKEIQQSIRRIGLVLQKVLRDTEKLNEEESETIKEFREIQKKYDLASEAISNMVELLKPGGVSEIPKMLTNDAYSALVDLAIHFPSVAPFGAGKENRKDFNEYDVKFNSAIEKVKDDLQNVFSLMKTGQAGEESLILALDGIKEFSAQIQAIFGVTSEFEELKIDRNEEAAEGKPQAEKEPEEEKYSDEISEEDKELITAAIQDHKEFYEKALETFKKLEAADPDKTTMSPEAAVNTGQTATDLSSLQEIMKKTEDQIKSLNNNRKIAQRFMEKVKSGKASQKYQQQLRKVLNMYIKEYQKLSNAVETGDFNSVIDSGEKRVGKVRSLLDTARKYLDKTQALSELYTSILRGVPFKEDQLEEIHKALVDSDGGEAERLTGDMKNKIKRASLNITNVLEDQFDLSKMDLSGFKKFVGAIADRVSELSIKLRNKIKEEEEGSEPEETEQAREKELKQYQENLEKAYELMHEFVGARHAFQLIIELPEDDIKALEKLDNEYSSIKNKLKQLKDYTVKISTIFANDINLVRDMKQYGFPPKGTEIPEPVEVEGDPDAILDIDDFKKELSINLNEKIDVIEKDLKKEHIEVLYKFYKHVISLNENEEPPAPPEINFKNEFADGLHDRIKDKKGLNLNRKGIKQFIYALKQKERMQLSHAINFLSTEKKYIEGFKKMLGQTGSTEPTDTDNEKELNKPTFNEEQKDQEELFDYLIKILKQQDLFIDDIQEISRDWDSGYEDDTGQKMNPFEKPEKTDAKRKSKLQSPEEFIRSKLVRFTYNNKDRGRTFIKQVMTTIDNYITEKKMSEKEVYRVAENLFSRKDVLDYFQSIIRKEPSEEKPISTDETPEEEGEELDLSFNRDVQEQIATKLKPLIREMLNKGK